MTTLIEYDDHLVFPARHDYEVEETRKRLVRGLCISDLSKTQQ